MSNPLYFLAAILLLTGRVFSNEQTAQKEEGIFELLGRQSGERPQEPKPPYPYLEEEVSFENDGVTLAGTLTLPKSKGPFPVVVLLHGSAPLDRNESMFGHKFFLVWADHLTRQGIAVLRFDKRSAGKSTGDYATATIEDFASDALAAVKYLKTRKDIDPQQIGMVGHSEGGMTAPLAASKSKDIAFVVLMAAPTVSWKEIIMTQAGLFQRADGVPEETIEHNSKLLTQLFKIMETEKDNPEKSLRETITTYRNNSTPYQRQIFETYYGTVEEQTKHWNAKWFRYYFTYQSNAPLKQLQIPVLALYGDRDVFVPSKQNSTLMAELLKQAGNKDFTVMELPRLNHVFQTCQTGSIKEISVSDETTSPVALNAMSDWILKRTSRK